MFSVLMPSIGFMSSQFVNQEGRVVHVISNKPFSDASVKYPNDRDAIMNTYNVLRKAEFDTPSIMKETFTSLDNFKYKNKWWIIDIGGNNLRLISAILFS